MMSREEVWFQIGFGMSTWNANPSIVTVQYLPVEGVEDQLPEIFPSRTGYRS
jgi:hypothetical protein